MLPPVEIKRASKSRGSQDILDDNFFTQLKEQARQPGQLWHFGLPCSSFSVLQHTNGGTRRKGRPQGSGVLARELEGNEILRRTLMLVDILVAAGNWWTVENPRASYAWLMSGMQKLVNRSSTQKAIMHQCAYGLGLRDSAGNYGPCKKHTKFIGNLPGLSQLCRTCHCRQPHVYAVGGVKTKAGWKRRSELAGHYPTALCRAYSTITAQALEQN